jgi:hypothetical protein
MIWSSGVASSVFWREGNGMRWFAFKEGNV